MPSLDTIRKITVQGRTDGVREATADLKQMAAAQDGVAASSDRTQRATLSMEKRLESLQRRFDADYRAQQDFSKAARDLDRAQQQGLITQDRHLELLNLAANRYGVFKKAQDDVTKSSGLARHELVNLGRQFQDVATMAAMGASPMSIISSQGAQIFDIFSSSQGTVKGFFGQMVAGARSVITPMTAAIGTVATLGTAAVIAAAQWGSAQRDIDKALSGIGRASGLSRSDVNRISGDASSLFGFSVSEAREFTNALASTGRIGRENIEPLVKAGHDVARVLGVDGPEAAQMLAKAFSDPVKGADDLNSRLGFMDAAMQRQIASLMAQNRVYEAQRVLLDGIQQSIRDNGAQVSTTTKFWTAFGNVISNAWDKFGEGASRITGIGFTEGLDEQIERTKTRIAELEKIAERRSDAVNKSLGTTAALDREREKLEQLTGAWNRYWQSVEQAQQKRDSFAQRSLVVQQLPEIDVRQNLQDQLMGLELLRKGIEATGGEHSEVLRRMNVSWDQFSEALARARSQVSNFRTDFERSIAQQDIAMRSLTAFSPSARGEIAYAQRFQAEIDRGTEATKAATLAERDRQIAIKGVTVAISEQARERHLAAEQAVRAADLEISLIGKSVGEQARMRADLQMRQQMEQEAARNRTAFDEAEYARLQKINAELGRKVQLRAQADLVNQLQFERSQLGMTDTEASMASRLRSIYGDDLSSAAAQSALQMMRVNEQLRQTRELMTDFVSGFAADFRNELRNGANAWDAFVKAGMNALNRLADKLMDIALQNLVLKAFGGLIGGWTGGVPLAGGAPIGQGGIGHAHTGGTIGETSFVSRYVHPAYFDDAPRYHSGLDMGPIGGLAHNERPIIAKVGERVVTPEQWADHTGGNQVQVVMNNDFRGVDPASVSRIEAKLDQVERSIPGAAIAALKEAQRHSVRLN
jgi:hypothetical protein